MRVNLIWPLDGPKSARSLALISSFLMAGLFPAAQSQATEVPVRWRIPDIVIHEADRPASPNVLGTIALAVRARPTSTRWARIMTAPLDEPILIGMTENARYLPPREQVAFVQMAVNSAINNSLTSNDCSDDGYWAAADETFARGRGDCFDIAVAKMEALRLLGFPNRDLYLTTGYFSPNLDSVRGRESAALLVRIGESFWLLPDRSEHVVEAIAEDDSLAGFSPVVTYGVGTTWVHGRIMKTAMLDQ